MDIVNNPHDKFFKSTFGDINTAKDFLDNYLSDELKNIVDLESIRLETGTELFDALVIYILNVRHDLEIEDIYDMAKEVSKERSDKIMTLADKLRQEGMEKGMQIGMEYLLWKQILKKFPKTPESYYDKIKKLQSEKLDILGMELMDMKDMSELDRYL